MVFVRIDGDGEPVPIAKHVREKIGGTFEELQNAEVPRENLKK